MADFLGGVEVTGGKMKVAEPIHWISTNTGVTNKSGFSTLPGGAIIIEEESILIVQIGGPTNLVIST